MENRTVMKKLLLLILLLLPLNLFAQGGMGPGPGTVHSVSAGAVFVQQSTTSIAAGTGGTVPFGTPITAGSSVILFTTTLDSVTINSCQMTGGGAASLTLGKSVTVTGVLSQIWYVHNLAGGETAVGCTRSGSSRTIYNGTEWTGLKNAGPENTNSNTGLLDASPATGNATPASASNLLTAIGGWGNNDYSTGPTNSFTRLTPGVSGAGIISQESAYKVQLSATVDSTAWTLTAGINWCAAIAAFGAN